MRILFLTQTYLPEPLRIIAEFAESMQAAGHELFVLTGFPNYPEGKLYPGYRLKIWQRETINGIPVIRLPLFPDHGNSRIRRLLNYLSFSVSTAFLGPWILPAIDVIHVYDPPYIGPSAWLLSRLRKVPLTIEIQDLWPETLGGAGLKNRALLAAVDRLTMWWYRRSAGIRVISPGFRDNLLGKGVAPEKVYTIPNWVDTDLFRPMDRNRELAAKFGLAGRFNVVYAGNMGMAQCLDVTLDAASLLRDTPEIQFVLVGYGTDMKRLRETARRRNLTNVLFIDRRPEEEMPALLALADVLLVQLRDDPVFRITIPHKTYIYMACGQPILAAVAGETAKLVESSQAGIACPPTDPQSMVDAVRRFYAMTPGERSAMGENGRRAVCGSFDRGKIVEAFEAMFAAAVKSRRAASIVRRG